MSVDPILAYESLGYTEREASFLYLVAVHSGYFLRRQFDFFINRQKGAIAHNFLEKARAAGHIEVIDYGEARHVYHLFSKPMYRLLGIADSQNRRLKGDGPIRARLIALDCILENDKDHYLESDRDKVHYFSSIRRIPRETFTDRNGRLYPVIASCPVAVVDRTRPAASLVRFVFADEALITAGKFDRLLATAELLFRSLGAFELIYASNSAHNFTQAEALFRKRFDAPAPNTQGTLSRDWGIGLGSADTEGPALVKAQFTTMLLHWSYPRIRRNEVRALASVRRSGLAEFDQRIEHTIDRAKEGSGEV